MEDFYYNCCDKIQLAIEKYIESTGYKPTEITMNECDFEKLKSYCKIQVVPLDDITHIFGLKINTSKYIEPLTFNIHMKTHKITEDQIREAHAAACTDWKTKIESWFPDMYELKSGGYRNDRDGKWLVYIDLENDVFYGFDSSGDWFFQDNVYGSWSDRECPATPEEVEKRLIEEAKRRGFVEGVSVRIAGCDDFILRSNKFKFFIQHNTLGVKHTEHSWVNIFDSGQWAEIVEEETYSIGDRFVRKDIVYRLCKVGSKEVCLINEKDYVRWSDMVAVGNVNKITKQEFNQITDNYEFKKI